MKSHASFQEATSSSGRRRVTLPLPFLKTPSRCHLLNKRLTVNGVTFAPAATSSFPIGITIPSGPPTPIPQARLIRYSATRDCASSELRLTVAPINHAMCSVTAIDNALSNNFGVTITNSRRVVRCHINAQLSDNTSVLARYLVGSDKSAAPPK